MSVRPTTAGELTVSVGPGRLRFGIFAVGAVLPDQLKLGDASVAIGQRLRGDLDEDGDVDLADFSEFQRCFTGPGASTLPDDCEPADLDNDGDVDVPDFHIFALNFTGPQ